MIRNYFKIVNGVVFEIVEYLSTGKVVQRELNNNGIPVDITVVKEGKS